jgi:hypothetical protein
MTSTPYLIASKKFFKLSETCNTAVENRNSIVTASCSAAAEIVS